MKNDTMKSIDVLSGELELGAVDKALQALAKSVGAAVAANLEREAAGLVADVVLEQQIQERSGGAVSGQLVLRCPGQRVKRRQAVLRTAPDHVGGPVGALQQRAAVDPDRAANPALRHSAEQTAPGPARRRRPTAPVG